MGKLILFCKHFFLLTLPTFVQPAFQPLLQPSYTGLFEHPLPTTKTHTSTMAASITQRHHVTTAHGKEPGAEGELIYAKRGYSHCVVIFI